MDIFVCSFVLHHVQQFLGMLLLSVLGVSPYMYLDCDRTHDALTAFPLQLFLFAVSVCHGSWLLLGNQSIVRKDDSKN